MELATIGREIYPGMEVPVYYHSMESGIRQEVIADRFRVVLVEKGTGIMRLGNQRILFTSPSVFCISERELPVLEQQDHVVAKTVYFHPKIVNAKFEFEVVRCGREHLTATEKNDHTCLNPFYVRSESFRGHLSIGLSMAKRISLLIEETHKELTDQRDGYWPCRGRSYFLELLFCIERLYFKPEHTEEIVLKEASGEIEHVLLYLHSNYNKKITITNLTKNFNINRTTLNKQFNKVVDMPIMTYLIKHRIRLASMILRDTMVPVSEVAERVGFGDITNFTRVFRKYTGSAPSEYRQQNCWLAN